MRFLVDTVVARAVFVFLAREPRRDLIHAVIQFGGVLRLSRDNERRARFINQDRVHLVDDRVIEAALKALRGGRRHVVAQIIETEFVIWSVRDLRAAITLLFSLVDS